MSTDHHAHGRGAPGAHPELQPRPVPPTPLGGGAQMWGKRRGLSVGWTGVKTKAGLVGAIYPKLGTPASSNEGEFWEVSSGLPLGQGEFCSGAGGVSGSPARVPEAPVKAEIAEHPVQAQALYTVAKPGCATSLKDTVNGGQSPSCVPTSSRTAVLDRGQPDLGPA